MATKVNPTPTLKDLDAKKFIDRLNTPSTEEELKSLKKADDVFNKVKYIP